MAPAAPSPSKHRFRAFVGVKRLVRDESGVTLIEFSILAVPFFAIIVAILETSLVFLASQILDSAVGETTRQIRTGVAQSQNVTATGYRTRICDRLYGMFDCSKLKIKVGTVGSFTAASTNTSPIKVTEPNKGEWTVVENFQTGLGSDIVLVEVYYKWPILMNFGGFNLDDVGDGTRLLASVRLFKNEPF